jgi:hypothetical protein
MILPKLTKKAKGVPLPSLNRTAWKKEGLAERSSISEKIFLPNSSK